MPTESLLSPASVAPKALPRHRYRLRFAKFGDLRLVSHHDLMHVLERMMRRAEVPFAVTQGFHPQPKMSFALSLALGTVGRNEVFDLELTCDMPADELRERLNRVAPAGLTFSSCAPQEKKPSSQVRRMFYRVEPPAPFPSNGEAAACTPLSPGERGAGGEGDAPRQNEKLLEVFGSEAAVPNLPLTPNPSHAWGEGCQPLTLEIVQQSIAAFLALSEYWIQRTRPQPRRLNIRPFVESLSASSSSLSMVLWVAPQGAARPEEILAALGLGCLLEEGAVLERSHLELLGELPEHERFVPDFAAASAPSPKSSNACVGDERSGQRSVKP
jgi:hypothetical protein